MTERPLSEKTIFEAAIEIASLDERAAYLAEACGSDEHLRADVDALLAAHDRLGSILLAAGSPAATIDEPVSERPGTVIGPYKLMEQIGEGGMGLVFVAEQQQPVRRKVALKVIKPGMDTRQVIARFEAERQALALMDHHNIAKVHDGGETAGGRPYFVMELVKGVPITQYCDQYQADVRERLELFVDVCEAVQHAHQKGIIHRDLKPSNVLVTSHDGKPVVKVIDFGVAKAIGQQLTDKTVYTQFSQMIGTPMYMSPEQAGLSGLDVDTRSDIYSLGVLLYELLTGTTPFDKERFSQVSYDEMRRIIREEEPPKPSTRISTLRQAATTASERRGSDRRKLSRLFRGDLDWIVMKALEKDRNRRYETSSAFAADVQRYLHDEPVQACPPSASYRLRKFLRRNKRPALAVGLIVLLLAAGVAGTMTGLVREWRQADAIEQSVAEDMREARQYQREERWPDAAMALERAEGRLANGGPPHLRDRVEEMRRDAAMVARLEEARLVASNIQKGMPDYGAADGAYEAAFDDYGLGLEALGAEEAAQRVRDSAIAPQLLTAIEDWAKVKDRLRVRGGQSLWAVARLLEDDPWRQRLLDLVGRKDGPGLEQLAKETGTAAQPSVCLVLLAGSLADAGRAEAAERLLRPAQQRRPADFWINFTLASLLLFPNGVTTSEDEDRPEVAADALAYSRVALALRQKSPWAHVMLGAALNLQGNLAEAEAVFRKAIDLKPDFEVAYVNLGNVLASQGKLPEAIKTIQRGIELDSKYPVAYINLGGTLRKQGKLPEAIAAYRKAIELEPGSAMAYNNLGGALQAQGKLPEALAAYRKAIGLRPRWAFAYLNLGGVLHELGLASHDQRKLAGAIEAYRKAIDLNPGLADARYNLASSLQEEGKSAEAEAEFRKAIDLKPGHVDAHNNLGNALRAQGRPADAELAYRKALALKPSYAEVWYNLGLVLGEQQKLTEATKAFRKAIDLKPDYPEAYCDLGYVLGMANKQAEAEVACRKAIDLRPDFGRAYFNLGNALAMQKKLGEAVAAFRKAIALMPGFAPAQFNLGNALEDQGDLARAEEAFRKTIALKPEHAEAHCALGHVLRKQSRFVESLAALRRGHALGSPSPRWSYPSAHWVRQCEHLVELDARLSGFLEGKPTSASPGEWIEMAGLCSFRRLNRAAARCYAEAFRAGPGWADDVGAGHRFKAACAAALAGCGQGKDADKADDKELPRLRRLALDWLRADLTAWVHLLNKDTAKPPRALAVLRHWLTHPDFTGVRGKETLAKLPEAEQREWQKLWEDVTALLNRAQGQTAPDKK